MMPSDHFDVLVEFSAFERFFSAEKLASPFTWGILDHVWRKRRYGRRVPQKRGRDRHLWRKSGWQSGQAPNCFFDTDYYLQTLSEKERGQAEESPLAFYLKNLSGPAPHWLFSEQDYAFFTKALPREAFCFDLEALCCKRAENTEIYLNAYDHFCAVGVTKESRPHRFFHPEFFKDVLAKERPSFSSGESGSGLENGAWYFFLNHFEMDICSLRTSWYFDPKWYLKTYPQVQVLLEKRKYSSPLHHYLSNKTPLEYNPNPYFSEEAYLHLHSDVGEAIRSGNIRNGYQHFLLCGQAEGRCFCIDKEGYPRNIFHFVEESAEAEAEMQRLKADDLFSLYVAYHDIGKEIRSLPKPSSEASKATGKTLQETGQIIRLAQSRQEALFSVLSRTPLRVLCGGGKKEEGKSILLSIVLFSHGDYAALVSSIESLAPFIGVETEMLVISSGNRQEEEIVRKLVKMPLRFVRHFKTADILSFWESALEQLRGRYALWLEAGVRVESADFPEMCSFLKEHKVSALGAAVMQGKNSCILGGEVTLNGGLIQKYTSPEDTPKHFYRFFSGIQEIDLPAEGMVLFDIKKVTSAWQKIQQAQKIKDRIVWTDFSDFEALALSLREMGEKIYFFPSFTATFPRKSAFPHAETPLARWRRRLFPRLFLQDKPLKITFILPKLPQAQTPEESLLSQANSLSKNGFHVEILGISSISQQGGELEKFLFLGEHINWEEAPENLEEAFLEKLKTSDLLWIAGSEAVEKFLSFREGKGEEAYCPCLMDLRFHQAEEMSSILEKIADHSFIESVLFEKENTKVDLEKFPEIQSLFLSLRPEKAENKILDETLRFMIDRSISKENDPPEFLEKESSHVKAAAQPLFPLRPLEMLEEEYDSI